MKILITSSGPGGTGSAVVVEGLVNSLLQLGHQPKVVFPTVGLSRWGFENKKRCLYQPILFPRWLDNELFYTFPLIIPDPHPFNFNNAWTYKDLSDKQFALLTNFFRHCLATVCWQFQPDFVECQHIWLFAELICQLGLPYICTAHHSDQLGFLLDKRMQKLAKRAAQAAKVIFAVSELVKEEVVGLYHVDPEKVVVIPNGFNQEVFRRRYVNKKELLAAFRLPQTNLPIITFAGKLSRTKGIDVLLKANKILQAKHPVMLIILGAGSLEQTLTDSFNAYDFKNCYFLNHQPPNIIAQFHNVAELSVVPSRSEGFGITALEAMSCGTPVIATKVGALPQFVVGNSQIEPEDHQGLAEAILGCLALPPQNKQELRQKAVEAAQGYSWLEMTKKRLPFYEVRPLSHR